MPAPTALKRTQTTAEETALAKTIPLPADEDTELLDVNALPTDTPQNAPEPTSEDVVMEDQEGRPRFPAAKEVPLAFKRESRKIAIPPHRLSPLKSNWTKIYPPLVEHLKLQVRVNMKTRSVELRTSSHTTDTGALQKGEDFVKAFTLGFDTDDAIALLRLDDLYIETFEIKDVKTLQGEHMGRAIGRIAGKDGKTKFAIENSSKTRIVLADQKIHVSFPAHPISPFLPSLIR